MGEERSSVVNIGSLRWEDRLAISTKLLNIIDQVFSKEIHVMLEVLKASKLWTGFLNVYWSKIDLGVPSENWSLL